MSGSCPGSCPLRVRLVSGFASGSRPSSCPGSCPVRVWIVGFVSSSCLVRVRFVSVCVRFVVGSCLVRVWFVPGSCRIHIRFTISPYLIRIFISYYTVISIWLLLF